MDESKARDGTMIVERGKGREVIIRARDENGERTTVKETGFYPYCFVETEHANLFPGAAKDNGFTGLYGEDLTKITMSSPDNINMVKEVADQHGLKTWEANIPFVNRVLADRLEVSSPIPNYDHRIWYLDCEWNPVTSALRVMVFHDNFTGDTECLYVNPNYDATEAKENMPMAYTSNRTPGRRDAKGRLEFPNEESMLRNFITRLREADPDVITGWFVVGADIKTIIERCNAKGISPQSLSPLRRIRYKFGDWAQPIAGTTCIDLMVAFSKLWELKNGKLPGYKLDDVAEIALGEKKVELPDGHNTYHTDLELYLDYSIQDVDLLPKLDNKVNAIGYYTGLQHLVQCDIQATPYITRMFTNLVLQDNQFDRRIPTKAQFDKIDYQGADVMAVEPGVHENVGILDVKAMYHSNAALHNISWETLAELPMDSQITSNKMYGHDCGNGTLFSKHKKGLLVRQMDLMTGMRNQYKDLIVTDPDNKARWDAMQYACKSLVASMYGVCGDSKYGMYHPKVADAITFTSRQTLKKLRDVAAEVGWKTIYGHTDSIFVTGLDMGSNAAPHNIYGNTNLPYFVDKGVKDDMKKLAIINEKMAPIEVQFERYCDRMLLMAKNRYAGNVRWTDGEFHKPTLYVKGIEMKQSRMPPVMKEAMGEVIGGILADREEKVIEQNIKELTLKVINGEVEPRSLCMKGKLTRDLHQYKALSGPSAGAAWANEYLGKRYRSGDFFLTTIGEDGKYMAFDDPEDIEGLYGIGFKHLANRFIIKKIQPYWEMMGWDIQPLLNVLDGKGDLVWL